MFYILTEAWILQACVCLNSVNEHLGIAHFTVFKFHSRRKPQHTEL